MRSLLLGKAFHTLVGLTQFFVRGNQGVSWASTQLERAEQGIVDPPGIDVLETILGLLELHGPKEHPEPSPAPKKSASPARCPRLAPVKSCAAYCATSPPEKNPSATRPRWKITPSSPSCATTKTNSTHQESNRHPHGVPTQSGRHVFCLLEFLPPTHPLAGYT